MGLNQNTWKLNQWYDQDVAGNVSYSGAGELWVAGLNSDYIFQTAIPLGSKRSSPVQIPGTEWVQGRGGGSERPFVAMKKDGSVWSWGKNYLGGLGLNQSTPATQSSAQQVIAAPSTGVQGRLNSDENSTMFSKDGELWIWGSNAYGKLGLNEGGAPATANAKSSPCQVGTESTWSKNISGSYSKVGVKTDGTLWAWGLNNQGQLGQNDTTQRSSPIQVGTDTTWSTTRGTLAGGGQNVIGAIKTDGTLWTWGYNDDGALGLNNTTSYSSPKQVPGTNWQYISFTDTGGFAQKTDGTIWSWGKQDLGELGHNNKTSYSSPKQIGAGTDWAYVRAGLSQKAWGLKTDNTLWVWGQNIEGQMGLNNQIRYSSPVQIPGTDWRSSYDGIDLGNYQSYFLKEI